MAVRGFRERAADGWLFLSPSCRKPRGGASARAAAGRGKKAILSFADVSEKKINEMRCGGINFELVNFGVACCCKG